MNKSANLYVRVNPQIKREAEELYQSFGLTISDAINIFLIKSIMEHGLPFEMKVKIPNDETLEAIKELDDHKKGIKKLESMSVSDFFAKMEEEG